jgi:hypothetical protein
MRFSTPSRCLTAGLLAVCADSVLAQDAIGYEQYRVFSQNAIKQRIYPAFERVMSEEQWAKTQTIQLTFPDDLRINHLVANHAGGAPRIDISTGTLVHMHRFVEAGLYVSEFGGEDKHFEYLEKTVREVRAASAPGSAPGLAMSYFEFAKEDSAQVARWRQKHYGAINEIMIEALAFFLAHEMAHHLLDHSEIEILTADHARRSRDQEYAADSFAISLITKAGFNPIPALPYFGFMAAYEGFATRAVLGASHDPSLCRYLRFLKEGSRTMLEDTGFRTMLEQHPKLRSQYQQMMRQATQAESESSCNR